MKRLFLLFLLLSTAFAVCGNLICEKGEETWCRDCAFINQNYVCDSYPGISTKIKSYDPDCISNGSCYGPQQRWFTYSNGRGKICYPGVCEPATGCDYTCSSDSDCTGFCIGGKCSATCPESYCRNDASGIKILPVMSNIYLGKPTFVIFAVIAPSSVTELELKARAPCNVSYDNVTLEPFQTGTNMGYAIVGIDDCLFTGLGSVVLEAPAYGAKGVVHFLSYPAKLYETGRAGRSSGEARYATTLNSTPVEVVVWVS